MSHTPVTIYTTSTCGFCHAAKRLLTTKKVAFDEINLSEKPPEVRQSLMERTQHRTVPQIFIGEQFIGGFDDMNALNASGELDKLLSA